MNRQEALITLLENPGITRREINALISHYGSPERAAASIGYRPPNSTDTLSNKDVAVFHSSDSGYPQQLLRYRNAPAILTVQGSMEPEDIKAIAIVGTREPTSEGITKAYQMAHELALQGYTIVSGLARGIDTAAHWGALQAGGRTFAVIGSGLEKIYPHENENLAQAIAKQGAVISEYPLKAEPKRHHFPQRNRIISGLSLGVLLIEAPQKSGAVMTMERAAKQGLPLFVLPGRPNTKTTEGNLYLLRKHKTTLVESAHEVVTALKRHVPEQLTFSSLSYEQIGVN